MDKYQRKRYKKLKTLPIGIETTPKGGKSIYEVTTRIVNPIYCLDKTDTRDSEIVSLVKAPYEDILHPQLTPNYYVK